jgi:hypothetical protein
MYQTYLSTTNNALVLVIAKTAFVADSYQGCWPDVGIANWAFTVAFIAETSNRNTGLFAAHNQISVEVLAWTKSQAQKEAGLLGFEKVTYG